MLHVGLASSQLELKVVQLWQLLGLVGIVTGWKVGDDCLLEDLQRCLGYLNTLEDPRDEGAVKVRLLHVKESGSATLARSYRLVERV